MPQDVVHALSDCVKDEDGFVELRFHKKTSRGVSIEKGRVENSSVRHRTGTGVRVLEGGVFGFASCSSAEPAEVKKAIAQARAAAEDAAALKAADMQAAGGCTIEVLDEDAAGAVGVATETADGPSDPPTDDTNACTLSSAFRQSHRMA